MTIQNLKKYKKYYYCVQKFSEFAYNQVNLLGARLKKNELVLYMLVIF